MSHHLLDARRLLCPLPVIRTQNRVAGLAPGDTLDVLCTDPGAANDIPAWCRINGHELLGIEQQAEQLVVSVRVGPGDG